MVLTEVMSLSHLFAIYVFVPHLHVRKSINNYLHLFVSLFTCGYGLYMREGVKKHDIDIGSNSYKISLQENSRICVVSLHVVPISFQFESLALFTFNKFLFHDFNLEKACNQIFSCHTLRNCIRLLYVWHIKALGSCTVT